MKHPRDMTLAELAEDREQVRRLIGLLPDEWNLSGFTEWEQDTHDQSVSAVQAALRALANPAPVTPPEPTDPAVRVVDSDDDEWARRSDGAWVCIGRDGNDVAGAVGDWDGFQGDRYRVITPDAPTDRPLKVGDRVKVADNASGVAPNAWGREAVIRSANENTLRVDVRDNLGGSFPQWVMVRDLTLLPKATS